MLRCPIARPPGPPPPGYDDGALRDPSGRTIARVVKRDSVTLADFQSQVAADAAWQKELTAVLILQMLSKHIGDELACVVTGLTGFGVFAQCQKYGIDGLIKLEDLGPDHWRFNKLAQCIIGERSGEAIRLGRPMRVYIASVDVPSRRLNVAPVEPLGGGKTQPYTRTHKAQRKAERKGKGGKGGKTGRRSKRRA
jgi:ribonuclease R